MNWLILRFDADFDFAAVHITFGYRNFEGINTASALGRCNSLLAPKAR